MREKGWRPWAREFKNQIFGSKPKRKDPNRHFRRQVRNTARKNYLNHQRIKHEVRSRGWL